MTIPQLITRCDECDWQGEPADGCPACEQNERMTNSAGDLMGQCEGFAELVKDMLRGKADLTRVTHELRSWRALESHILGEE